MNLSVLFFFAFFLQAPQTSPDAFSLVDRAIQQYSDAKSYRIEATDERSTSNEFQRSWQKSILTAVVAPNQRYRYEGRGAFGDATIASNGTRKWIYHALEHSYIELPESQKPNKYNYMANEEYAVLEARGLLAQIKMLRKMVKTASFLADDIIVIDGRPVECRVIRFTYESDDSKPRELKIRGTLWIEKSTTLVRKISKRTETFTTTDSGTKIPLIAEQTTEFRVVTLNQAEPDSVFAFTPPSDAKLVERFPMPKFESPIEVKKEVNLVGKLAPELHFRRDGKDVALSAFKGRPVLVELWATWCAPCVEMSSELKQLHSETATKGLVFLSVDTDEDAKSAVDFMAKEHLEWANYHDEENAISKTLGGGAIPMAVLIDANGVVTFHRAGYEVSELRAAIAKLGPEFASVAPPARQ